MSTSNTYPVRFATTQTQTSITGDPQVTQTSVLKYSKSNISNLINKGGALPHYRKLISSGLNATTYMEGTKYEYESQPGHAEYSQTRKQGSFSQYPDARYIADGDMVPAVVQTGTIVNGTSFTVASNQGLSNYYSNVAAVESIFKGMVFTGELRESLRMIRSPAKALRSGISDYLAFLKKRGPGVPKHRRKSFVRETWLEYAFGWKPLISDIDSGMKAFFGGPLVLPIFRMCSGVGRHKITSLGSPIQQTFGPLIWWYRVRHSEEYVVRYFGVYRSTGNGSSEQGHRYGFRPSEFVPTLWELIPYSFLVDYFSNIGDIVSSWSYRFLAGPWTSRLQHRTHTYESCDARVEESTDTAFWSTSASGNPGSAVFKRVTFIRTPDVGTPLPSFELQVPGYGSTKWINLLALSKQLDGTRRALAR